MILRGLSKFAIFYTFFAIYYCFPFRGKNERKGKKRKVLPTKKETPRAANSLKSPAFAVFPFFAVIPTNPPFRPPLLILGFLFNKYFPPALPLLYHFPTIAAPAIFAPFPAIWRRFSLRPVLAPVQKFNAIKQPPFRFRCKLLTFTDFADLLRGGIVARLWEIVEIWGVSVRNRASLIFEHALKSAYCRVLFILSPKSGPRSDFLPNVVPFGLFL